MLGLFRDQAAAERGVNQLAAAGFNPEEIGILGPGDTTEPPYFKATAAGVTTGAAIGGAAGLILGAASVGAIPGIGPVLVGGALVPVIVLGFTGTSAGMTLGGLFAGAATQDQGLYYMQEVRGGRWLVTVTTDRLNEARAALEAVGAMEVANIGRSETAHRLAEDERPQDAQGS